MSIIRIHKQKNFSIISNTALSDSRLTFKAKGLWAYLLSKPDDWNIYVNQLAKIGPDGKTAIYSALKELKEYGYVKHCSIRKDGKIRGYEYVINEEPTFDDCAENLNTENLNAENLHSENRDALINTDYILKTDNNNDVPPPSLSSSQTTAVLVGLLALIPKSYQKPSVEILLKRALSTHTERYISQTIQYTNDHSSGHSWQKYKAFLGKALDGGWGEGYEPDQKNEQNASFQALSDKDIKILAAAGNKHAQAEIVRRSS